MSFNSSAIIIIVVVAFAFYLIYSQNSGPKYYPGIQTQPQISHFKSQQTPVPCEKCEMFKQKIAQQNSHTSPQINSILIENDSDPYSDPIKKQDLYGMYDHLTYPQMRLPREILDKYNEYYEKNGSYPPFNQATQPLFDNPILNGILIKQVDDNEPFSDNIPSSVPLFRVKSAKNTNRFFYYIVDQRYMSKLELKIPLDHIKINNIRYNAEFYGLPELYDGDIIENIPIYPTAKFKVTLYKTYHFP
jgi:hypothetical protein